MDDDRFSIWLAMAARDRSIRKRIAYETGRRGRWNQIGAKPGFSGIKIGRGAGIGRVLAAASHMRGAYDRSVSAETRVVRPRPGSTSVRVHLRYLVRGHESQDRRLELYGAGSEAPDRGVFARACRNDRHQFRTVVSAVDACEYEDLRPLVRRLMEQAARDLRTDLDWVAADHYDTGSPHSHIVIRGLDDRGGDLVIAREYLQHGFRVRAAELVTLDLGPVDLEVSPKRDRRLDIMQERATGIDYDLVAARDEQGRVSPDHPDRWEQAARAGRLRALETLGLAHAQKGHWYVQPDLVGQLQEIAWRNRMARDRADSRARLLEVQHGAEGPSPGETAAEARPAEGVGRLAPLIPGEEVDPHFQYFETRNTSFTRLLCKSDHISDQEFLQRLSEGLKHDRRRWEIGGDLGEGSDRRPGPGLVDGAGFTDRLIQRQLRNLEQGYDRG